MRCDIVGVGNK